MYFYGNYDMMYMNDIGMNKYYMPLWETSHTM